MDEREVLALLLGEPRVAEALDMPSADLIKGSSKEPP